MPWRYLPERKMMDACPQYHYSTKMGPAMLFELAVKANISAPARICRCDRGISRILAGSVS